MAPRHILPGIGKVRFESNKAGETSINHGGFMSSSVPNRFIDLFAGLGGFHQAAAQEGWECAFACELDPVLNDLYLKNYGVKPAYDIRDVLPAEVPDHDLLCAGFPCTSFSKAGKQEGLQCPTNGDLIFKVLSIIEAKQPAFVLLENVPNLEKHNEGETMRDILRKLSEIYGESNVTKAKMSPHEFGIPQVRERLFIVAARDGLGTFDFPIKSYHTPDIRKVLDADPVGAKPIPDYLVDCINIWQQFVAEFPKDKELPSYPIWAMEFGASYPLDGAPPLERRLKEMQQFRGSFGMPLAECNSYDKLEDNLPHYAQGHERFPTWKVQFIEQNRELYRQNKTWIDKWLPKVQKFPHSLQKLEWNCKGETRNIWDFVLQIRASGVRVKRATTAPSLIAMTTTQVPIIGWESRYMTPTECARLQSMDLTKQLPSVPTRAYKALGNAVNVELVQKILKSLIHQNLAEPEAATREALICK